MLVRSILAEGERVSHSCPVCWSRGWSGTPSSGLNKIPAEWLGLDFLKENRELMGLNSVRLSDLKEINILIRSLGEILSTLFWPSSRDLWSLWLAISPLGFGRRISFSFFYGKSQGYDLGSKIQMDFVALRLRLDLIWFVFGIFLIRFVFFYDLRMVVKVFRCGFGFCLRTTSLTFISWFSLGRLYSLSFFCVLFVVGSHGFGRKRVMAQLAFSKSKSSMVCTDTVTISNSVLAQRIQQFSMTLIGRLMNPACQNMESLIANFPKIWKLEEKVVGADLGQGVFQFNFEEEEDILSVLQNGPYHFDSWMVSLVRWEPVISSSYPSAINFWVKVSGIPMHLWEVATLEAIGKKLGKIQEVDEETGSLCVSVNGFNPLIFKMVVPFASSDEIVVSLEYEKLTGVCDHCSRITHDAKVCPGILKSGSGQVMDEKMDNRGGQRQTLPVKQEQHRNIGGWEKPRKHAKRALDFQSVDNGEQGYFPQQRYGGGGPYGPRQHEHPHGPAWGQRRNYGEVVTREEGSRRGTQTGFGESSGKAFGFHLNRKSVGLAWPKPLFKVKQASAEKQAPPSIDLSLGASGNRVSQGVGDQEGSGFKGDSGGHLAMDFEVETDDLLEDGEFDDTAKGVNKDVQIEAGSTVQGLAVHSSQGPDLQGDQGSETQVDSEGDPQGDGNIQRQLGKPNKGSGKPSDGGTTSKKGMGALPKPPART